MDISPKVVLKNMTLVGPQVEAKDAVPLIAANSDTKISNVVSFGAPLLSIGGGANVSVSDAYNQTPTYSVSAENAGDLSIENFYGDQTDIRPPSSPAKGATKGWSRKFEENWPFGKKS